MPKMKSNRSLQKRVKVTGSGKLMRKSPGSGHLKSAKSKKQLRNFRGDKAVAPGFVKGFKQLLGKKK